jgi:hypothetical protein
MPNKTYIKGRLFYQMPIFEPVRRTWQSTQIPGRAKARHHGHSTMHSVHPNMGYGPWLMRLFPPIRERQIAVANRGVDFSNGLEAMHPCRVEKSDFDP